MGTAIQARGTNHAYDSQKHCISSGGWENRDSNLGQSKVQQARGPPHKSFFLASLPSPPMAVDCDPEMESPSGTQEHGCSFLSLTLPQPPAQAVESAECPPHLTSPLACTAHPLSHTSAAGPGTPCRTPQATTTPYECTLESHHLKDALASQAPQKLVSQVCEILAPSQSIPLVGPPALQAGSSHLLLSFYTVGSGPSNAHVYLEVKDEEGLVLHLWSH